MAALMVAATGCGGDDGGSLTPEQQAQVDRRKAAEAPQTRMPPAGLSRDGVIADLRKTVLADARARRTRGDLEGRPFRGAQCNVARDDVSYAAEHPDAPVLRYSCIAYTIRSTTTPPQVIGQPFIARVDFAAPAYAWCLFTPVGGEGAHTALTFEVAPDDACAKR